MDLLIFGGQSNMQGQSEALSESAPVPRAFEYRLLTDSLIPLCNPVGEDIRFDGAAGIRFEESVDLRGWLREHLLGSACYGHTNLVPEFCRAYIEGTGRAVCAAHAAKGSTVLADWLPGSAGYAALVKKTRAAKRAARPERFLFIWMQGESDALAATPKETYKAGLAALVRALEHDTGNEKCGVIRVGRFAGDARDDAIMEAQEELCRENEDFLMLTTIAAALNDQPGMMNPFVRGHYSARGLETLGRAAGTALAAHVSGT